MHGFGSYVGSDGNIAFSAHQDQFHRGGIVTTVDVDAVATTLLDFA